MSDAPRMIRRLRWTTLFILVLAPLVSYLVPAAGKIGFFTLSDIRSSPGGFFGFLILLFNPYAGMAAVVLWLGRSPIRAWILFAASVVIGAGGALAWYDLLVRQDSILNVLALLSVVSLQWFVILGAAAVCAAVWFVERRSVSVS